MGLTPGTRLGVYEVTARLGAGGMGEVYRARDTTLHRDVALKVVSAEFAADRERLARFEREAQVLASLNHPHIAAIYGLEQANGTRAIVMELVDGPTLADRIAQGALPLEDTLPIARQIAEALEAAHEQGIVHRDLKPANIKVREDGTVKVLDFGLAKALDPAPGSGATAALANSPTITSPAAMTGIGVILGTAAYMSPEQARGKLVDARSDIWAFGCVVFEMLTAQRAFQGDDVTDTIVAVVSKEPEWAALPAAAAPVRPLLGRCLRKNPRQRLQAIGDARIQIDDLTNGTSDTTRAPEGAASGRFRPVSIAALAGAAAIAALATWGLTRPAPPAPLLPSRFEIVPPRLQSLSPSSDRDIAISPDGRYIVYRGGPGGTGQAQLVIRAVDRLEARTFPGITTARQPFFSPDSQWVAFFDGPALKKVSIAGGAPITICQVQGQSRGASWGDDNSIVFGTTDTATGLFRVSASGGELAELTTPDPAKGEPDHWYPSVLPGGRGVLFTITARNAASRAQVAVLDPKTGQHKTLTRGSQAEFVQGGHLLYVASETLHAVRFDLERLEVLGDPVPLVDGVWTAGGGAANYGVSRLGTLVYVPAGTQAPRSLVWVDRKGKETPISAPARVYNEPRLSPDGTRVALTTLDQENDIYVWDLAREGLTRLTFGPSLEAHAVWTSDGQRIVYSSTRTGAAGVSNLFAQAADGSGAIERLTTGQNFQRPSFIAPDGMDIVGYEQSPTTAGDIVRFPLGNPASRAVSGPDSDSSSTQVEALIRTVFTESNPAISPDGRYLAYQSNESGPFEIYVRPFPKVNDGRWQVSTAGGTSPLWARDGRELFYLDLANALTAAPVHTSGAGFIARNPARVLDGAYAEAQGYERPYDVSPDGRRFLMIKELAGGQDAKPAGLVVVLNWFDELRQRLPVQ